MKLSIMILIITLCVIPCSTARANGYPADLEFPVFGAPAEIAVPFVTVQSHDCETGTEDGVNVMYVVSTGKPAVFNVYDMDNLRLLRSYELEGAGSCREHIKDSSGNVYIITSENARLFRYSPIKKTVEDLGSIANQTAAYQSAFDTDGNLYIGTYPGGYVVKFNPLTGKFTNLGAAKKGNSYVRSLSFAKGYLWAGSNGVGNAVMVRVNPQTGEKKEITVPLQPDKFTEVTNIYSQTNFGRYTITYGANGKGNNCWMVFDTQEEKWTDICITGGGGGIYASPLIDGKSYFPTAEGMKYFEPGTCKIGETKVKSSSITSRKLHVVDFREGHYGYFGENTLVTVSGGGKPILINPLTGMVKTVAEASLKGGIISLQNFIIHDDILYAGAYLGSNAYILDLKSGKESYISMGQTECIKAVDGKIYFGIYPGGTVMEYDPKNPSKGAVTIMTLKNEQDRPYIIDGNKDYIVAGSVATYGKLGGALAVYDKATGAYDVIRNIVYNQSVVGLAIKDNLVYGSTTVSGGLGIEPTEAKAKIFVYDITAKRKIKEFIPDFPAEVGNVKIIGDLEFGADGLLWGASQGLIFAINPETFETVHMVKAGSTSYVGADHYWRPEYLRFSHDGFLYVTCDSAVIMNPETAEFVNLKEVTGKTVALMDVDSAGNLYFASGGSLMRAGRITGEPRKISVKIYTEGKLSNLGGITSDIREITGADYLKLTVIPNPFYKVGEICLNGKALEFEKTDGGLYLINGINSDSEITINFIHK